MSKDASDRPGIRRGRDAVPFAESHEYRMSFPRRILPPRGYPDELRTLGDHIRKRRLDLGMLQSHVARQIGVTESSIWNWEHGTEPELIHIPAIIAFLGYEPWETPEEPIERLAHFKRKNGLSFERLGEMMGCDPNQLAGWFKGREPINRNTRAIVEFLDAHSDESDGRLSRPKLAIDSNSVSSRAVVKGGMASR